MNSVIDEINNLDLNSNSCNSNNNIKQKFCLDNTLDSNHNYFVAKVQLNFYQIWSMFGELPCIYESGKCKYEWKFCHIASGTVFSLYDWNNPNNLLTTKTWYIGSSVNDKTLTAEFLSVLCDAIECYNTYYKIPIQNKTFKSEIPEVQQALHVIKQNICTFKSTLLEL